MKSEICNQLLMKINQLRMLSDTLSDVISRDENADSVLLIAEELSSSSDEIKDIATFYHDNYAKEANGNSTHLIDCSDYDVMIDGKRIAPDLVANVVFDDENSCFTIQLGNHFVDNGQGNSKSFITTLPQIEHDIFDVEISYYGGDENSVAVCGKEHYSNCQLIGIRRSPLEKGSHMLQMISLKIKYEKIDEAGYEKACK